jgi:hypothetical protein
MEIFVALIACLSVAVVLSTLASFRNPPKDRADRAKAYANWLTVVRPDLSTRLAAEARKKAILAQGPRLSAQDKSELKTAQLVIDGWHLWDGAQL